MTTHSDKALKTLADMNTAGTDWVHPEVKWVVQKLIVPGTITCPDCHGDRRSFYTVEDSQKAVGDNTVRAAELLGLAPYMNYQRARQEHAAKLGLVEQDCRHCYRLGKLRWGRHAALQSLGNVEAMVVKTFHLGIIQWPAGTKFNVSRFAYVDGSSPTHCQLCAKGIKKFGRVPLVTIKDGQPRAMFVGADCARKFTGVMVAKPEGKKKYDIVLNCNVDETK